MKKRGFTLSTILVIMLSVFTFSFFGSCEGPAGVAGEDANESCTQCHNEETLVLTAMVQHSNSGHQMGSTFERNSSNCAPCHTHQGYLEILASGEKSTGSDISSPLPVNCRTCHRVHENFDSTDFALRNSSPVEMWINGEEVDLGSGNQCVNCHQARIPNPLPVTDGGTVNITSSRWGPHHGTQSNILWGTGGYELAGSEAYNNPGSHFHTNAGCNGCHMAEPFGAVAGGHSFNMTYNDGANEHLAGCSGCHTDIESFDYKGASTEIMALLENLETILIDLEYINGESGLVNAPLQVSSDHAGAMLNYYMVDKDESKGVHNPQYAKALLQNSIEVFN